MPVVTISRMFGAGGSEVAAKVAAGLGWKLLDNAFIDGVAGRLGATPATVEAIEERTPTLAERLADTFALGSPEVVAAAIPSPLPPTEARVLDMTRRLIDETLLRGPAVLVGRGAQSYLAQRDDAIHVLCCAPFDSLVARVAAREGTSAEVAAEVVREKNHQRERYVKQYWHREWLAPDHYHVCVNTSALGIDGAAALVIGIARERFGSTTATRNR
jgi:cytidylate kinase